MQGKKGNKISVKQESPQLNNQSKMKYTHKFCEKWINIFNPWLVRCDDDPDKPFCKACQCRLPCNICHLQRHGQSTKHVRNLELLVGKDGNAAMNNISIQQRKKLNSSQDASEHGEEMGDDSMEANNQSKKKYTHKFCEKWLNIFNPWLVRCDDEPEKPFCKACQCRLPCNICHLQRHGRSTKHVRNLELLGSKGEDAEMQNSSIQKRIKLSGSFTSSQDASEHGEETTDVFMEGNEIDIETHFQFVQADGSEDGLTEEHDLKQEFLSADGSGDQFPNTLSLKQEKPGCSPPKKAGVKTERRKLFMQIQKDKNDLVDSFQELIGVPTAQKQSPPKAKDHVELFFDSVISSVRLLPPKLVAETKMRVSQLICELELRALTENEANASGTAAEVIMSTNGKEQL